MRAIRTDGAWLAVFGAVTGVIAGLIAMTSLMSAGGRVDEIVRHDQDLHDDGERGHLRDTVAAAVGGAFQALRFYSEHLSGDVVPSSKTNISAAAALALEARLRIAVAKGSINGLSVTNSQSPAVLGVSHDLGVVDMLLAARHTVLVTDERDNTLAADARLKTVEAWFSPAAADEALARLTHFITVTPNSGAAVPDPYRTERALSAFAARMWLDTIAIIYGLAALAFSCGPLWRRLSPERLQPGFGRR